MEHFNNILLMTIRVVIVIISRQFIWLHYIILLLKQNLLYVTHLKPFVDMDFKINVLIVIRDLLVIISRQFTLLLST